LKPKETIELFLQTDAAADYTRIQTILCKQVNATQLGFVEAAVDNASVINIEKDKFYVVTNKEVDKEGLKVDLLKDLTHQQGFLVSVDKKTEQRKIRCQC
jgi:valyl-tRNA synthetase